MTNRQHDIERYLRGEMTAQEMHALEKAALDDPFLSDALEGAANANKDSFLLDVHELQASVLNRSGKQGPKILSMWKWSLGIAATLFLVAVSGLYTIQRLSERNAQLSENEEKAELLALTESGGFDTLIIAMPRLPKVVATAEPMRSTRSRTESVTRQGERETQANLTDPRTIEIEPHAETQESVSHAASSSLSLNPRLIKGTVTSAEDGSALPGVNVVVQGTTTGTITDAEGKFEITVSQPDQKLEFSFIGVKTVVAETRNKNNVNVSLTPDYESLSEVVVAGKAVTEDKNKTFNLAQPQGGKDAYEKYLQQKLVYPEQALKNEVEGRVTIQFTVDDKGNLSNFKVINSVGFGCDEEAIRLVREGPAWSPSKKNDKAVTEEVKVGLKFDIPNKN
jgi:TonB family protein